MPMLDISIVAELVSAPSAVQRSMCTGMEDADALEVEALASGVAGGSAMSLHRSGSWILALDVALDPLS